MPDQNVKKSEQMGSGIVLLVVVALLIGIYFLRLTSGEDFINANIDTDLLVVPAKATSASAADLKVYENSVHKFKVQYPETWEISSSQTGEGENQIFTLSLENAGDIVSISVMSAEMEGIVRNSVSIVEEAEIRISGITANKLEATNAKDGSPISLVLIKNNGRLYDIQGTGKMFDRIVSNFILL